MSGLQRFDDARQAAPAAAAAAVQVIVDNPAQFAVMTAATIVLARTAVRVMRPRSALELLALMVVLEVTLPRLAMAAIDRGWMTIRIRDVDGRLVPLGLSYEIGDDDPPFAPAT